MRWLVLSAALLVPSAAATDANIAAQTQAATARLDEARLAQEAAATAEDPVTQLAAAVKAYDDGLIAARLAYRSASADLQAAEADLGTKPPQAALMTALLNADRAAGAQVHPKGPTASLRANLMRATVTDALAAQAATLKVSLQTATTARQTYASASDAMRTGLAGAQEARADLRAALAARAPLPTRFTSDPVQNALITANAASFAQVAEMLTTLYPSGLPNDGVLVAKGRIPPPVTGRVLDGVADEDITDSPRNGITIATPPGALVVSPTSATLLFHGPLLGFDNVAITEPTAGVLMIFAGLSETFGTPGEIIPAGTPLGLMGGEIPGADTNLTTLNGTETGAVSQALYLEIREGQTPADPANWFALEQ